MTDVWERLHAGTAEFWATLAATTDILEYARLMADDEAMIARELGIVQERNPWREAAQEIERLRGLVEERANG